MAHIIKKKLLVSLFLLLLAVCAPGPIRSAAEAQQPPTPVPASQPVVARIEFETRDQLIRLTGELDVWEVHPDEGYLLARISPEERERLVLAGFRLSTENRFSNLPDTIPNFECYRTIEELGRDLQQIAAGYPGIAQLSSIGSSYENRPLWVLRLTNPAVEAEKPVFLLLANIHGREVITPEVAMAFINHLVEYYGVDADVTWLLDHHEIQVIVSANPDGHVRNEAGYPWTYWRKNTQPYGSCSLNSIGVDLNRNFPTRWGCCGGSSGDPCAETYRGPAEKSEPETQAVIDAVRSLFPDQRLPGNTVAAPPDATGVLISLHSYGNLVLWPWGWTASPAPNGEELEALGRKLASFNRYTPKQASRLYPADGTTDDWSYGELGIASYTFEIGSEFYPSCSQVDGLIQPNIPALMYAAKVARAPYLLPQGPDAAAVTILEGPGGSPDIAAVIDDTANGGNPIAAAEITLDQPPWAGGESISMLPVDGAFDDAQEQVQADLEGLSLEQHTIFIRGQDALGYWGPVTAVYYNEEQPQIFLPFLIREQILSE